MRATPRELWADAVSASLMSSVLQGVGVKVTGKLVKRCALAFKTNSFFQAGHSTACTIQLIGALRLLRDVGTVSGFTIFTAYHVL